MSSMEESQLVNTIGHSAGAIIFGIFLVLLLRDRAPTGLRSSWRSLSAAALAFLWNIGSLAVLTHSLGSRSDLLVAFSFSVLSLLPAVLFDLSLDGQLRPIIGTGYALSFLAVAMHLWQIADPSRDNQRKALLLITVGFASLTLRLSRLWREGMLLLTVLLNRGRNEMFVARDHCEGVTCPSLFESLAKQASKSPRSV